jgi:anti-sigma factor RsiW
MSCPETPQMVADYLDQQLPEARREALAAHLQQCRWCREEAASLAVVDEQLRQWQLQSPPQTASAAGEPLAPAVLARPRPGRVRLLSSWLPLAASLVLGLAVVFNLQLSRDAEGFHLSFGAPGVDEATLQAMVQSLSAEQAAQQQRWLEQTLLAFSDSTAASLEQVVAWLEAQREQDMEMMEASLLEMIEREHRTVESMQQLASYVRYQTAMME